MKEYRPGSDISIIPIEVMALVPVFTSGCYSYATADAIYTMKLSHFEYDIHWEKTKLDILWLGAKGCKLIPELYEALKPIWRQEHGEKEFLSLKKGKEDFFTDAVTYVYDHDYLHELVAYPSRPMYENCLVEGEEVLIDKEKFFKMDREDQIRMFREETSVIAAERWMINPKYGGKISWYRAYMYSLRKTITRLTKGWASEFMVMNIEEFYKPEYRYFKHLIKTLKLEDK